jgi:hypothetical protein
MKLVRRVLAATTALVSLALVVPVVANAHDVLTPQQRYQAALHQYQQKRFTINHDFKVAIATDVAAEQAALAAATSPAQMYLARVNFSEAKATDVTKWETALNDLGKAPVLWTFTHPTTTTT